MLILLIAVVALFFVSRALVQRFGASSTVANATAAAFVVVFLAGLVSRGILFREEPPMPVAIPAPAPTPTPSDPPGKAVVPSTRALSQGQVNALTPVGAPVGYSNIESVGGGGANGDQIAFGTPMIVSGWAADPGTKAAAAGLLIVIDNGKRRYAAGKDYGHPRPDVARAFKSLGMLNTGFSITLPTTGLAKGAHTLALGAISADGLHYRIIWTPAKPFTIY